MSILFHPDLVGSHCLSPSQSQWEQLQEAVLSLDISGKIDVCGDNR